MNKRQSDIPKTAERIGRYIFKPGISRYVSGDLEEEFRLIKKESNRRKAVLWYWKQILLSLMPYLIRNTYGSLTLYKNYVKIAFRNLLKHKTYSFINIFSLTIGIAFCLLLAVLMLWEVSYNRFHENADRLYRIGETRYDKDRVHKGYYTVPPLGPLLKNNYPEVVDFTRFFYLGDELFRYEDKKFYENGIITADKSFFNMFTFPLIKGDKNNALDDPNSIVIDETTAGKYFGDTDPVGKIIKIGNQYDFIVKGVFKDVPKNSEFQFRIVMPWDYLLRQEWFYGETWENNCCVTYIMLKENVDVQKLDNKITNIINDHKNEGRTDISLQFLPDIHMRIERNGVSGMDVIYICLFICFFVLLISCINFMNLSTARSSYRFKEIGVRKIVGGTKKDIIIQFFGESLLLSFISLLFAIMLIEPLLYILGYYQGIHLTLNVTKNWIMLPVMLSITFITGILAASYPAVYLSSFNPLSVLKGIFHSGKKSLVFRRVLVTAQFSLTIIFMICGFVFSKQFDFLMNYNMGWDRENLMYISMRGDMRNSYNILRNELIKNPGIQNVSGTIHTPLYFGSSTSEIDWAGKDPEEKIEIYFNSVDFDFIKTIKAQMAAGKPFSRENTNNRSSFIINETLAEKTGLNPVVGENITFHNKSGVIVGVVKDFNVHSIKDITQPMILMLGDNDSFRKVLIKLNPENTAVTMDFIKETWKYILPDYPLEYSFLEDDLYSRYNDEDAMGIVFKVITAFTLFITLLGLMALIAFIAEKKKKEIGVRKVLGASSSAIVRIISREFFILILISNVIALPSAFFFTKSFLNSYAFRTEQEAGIYILSGMSILTVGLVTVIYQVLKAARANPADSLRCE